MTESSDFRETPSKYIEWKIPKFNVIYPKSVTSPEFSLPGAREKWFIKICRLLLDRKFLNIYLCTKNSTARHCVAFEIGIKKVDGSVFKSVEGKTMCKWRQNLCEVRRILRSELESSTDVLGPDGTLTVFCTAMIVDEPLVSLAVAVEISPSVTRTLKDTSQTPSSLSTVENASQTTSSNDNSILLEDFKNMYISGCYTDITILVKNKKFCAHRSVLASRSPVFASMFQHELEERVSGKVEILDCDPGSFEDFLLFLYTGKLDVSSCKAVELYRTADKYDMKELKDICVNIIHCGLCVDSFCDIIHLATIHFETDLLKAATEFFIENVESILPTTKWLQFSEENLSLSNELFMKFVKSKNRK